MKFVFTCRHGHTHEEEGHSVLPYSSDDAYGPHLRFIDPEGNFAMAVLTNDEIDNVIAWAMKVRQQ